MRTTLFVARFRFFQWICKRSQQIKWKTTDQIRPNIDSNKDTETHTCTPSSAVSMLCDYSLNEFVHASYWLRYAKLGICFRFAIFHQFSWFWWILFVKFRIPHMENSVNYEWQSCFTACISVFSYNKIFIGKRNKFVDISWVLKWTECTIVKQQCNLAKSWIWLT